MRNEKPERSHEERQLARGAVAIHVIGAAMFAAGIVIEGCS